MQSNSSLSFTPGNTVAQSLAPNAPHPQQPKHANTEGFLECTIFLYL